MPKYPGALQCGLPDAFPPENVLVISYHGGKYGRLPWPSLQIFQGYDTGIPPLLHNLKHGHWRSSAVLGHIGSG